MPQQHSFGINDIVFIPRIYFIQRQILSITAVCLISFPCSKTVLDWKITVITGMVIRYIRRSNNTKHRGDTNNHFPFYLTWRKTYVLANFFRKSWLRWWKKSFSLSKVKKESTGSKWGSKYCTKGNILLFLLNPKKLNLKGFTFLSFSLFYRKQLLSCHKVLKDTLKAFDKFKNKQKKCMKSCFLICKSIHILRVYSIHYTLR